MAVYKGLGISAPGTTKEFFFFSSLWISVHSSLFVSFVPEEPDNGEGVWNLLFWMHILLIPFLFFSVFFLRSPTRRWWLLGGAEGFLLMSGPILYQERLVAASAPTTRGTGIFALNDRHEIGIGKGEEECEL